MSLKELTGKGINEWGAAQWDCSCGEKHSLSTSFFIGEGAEENITGAAAVLAPSGCGIVLLKESGFDVEQLNRTLRRGGYNVYERAVDRNADYRTLETLTFGDDVRAVIGVGGGFACDCAKYLAAFTSLDCGMVVRAHSSPSFLVPSASLGVGGMPKLFKTPCPKVVVCDPALLPANANMNAAAFGAIVSRLIALFDWKFACLVCGEKMCAEIYDAALAEVDSVLRLFRGITRRDPGVKEILLESGLRLSALAAMSASSRLYSGGDTACALALSALKENENRKTLFEGENEFLFSLILLETYPKLFAEPSAFMPPPDNNMRAEKLVKYLGISEKAAVRAVSPYFSQKLSELFEYRLTEYERELKEELAMLKSRFDGAYRIFRRLHGDDGFSLRGYLGVEEARLCIAFAPEMRSKYTALTYMKNAGHTDAYLLD